MAICFNERKSNGRKTVTEMNKLINTTGELGSTSDKEVLEFYNLATGRILTGLEVSKMLKKDMLLTSLRRLLRVFNKYFIVIFTYTLKKDLGTAQSSSNWKILMSYFNMIQCLESAGIGLVYGLR